MEDIYNKALDKRADLEPVSLYERSQTCYVSVTGQSASGSGYYLLGDTVPISTSATTADKHFVLWNITGGNASIEDNASSSTTLTLDPDSSTTIQVSAQYEDHAGTDDRDCTTPIVCSTCKYELKAANPNHAYGDYEIGYNPGQHIRKCTNEGCNRAEFENCDYSIEATCRSPVKCPKCGGTRDNVNPNNHEGQPVWKQTAKTHEQVYECCGAVVVDKADHTWEDGVCTVCGYACQHSGGASNVWTQENGKHYHACENGCGAHLDEEPCSGGEESYFALPVCVVCGNEYGALLVDTKAPAGEISIENDVWKSLLNTITFDLFFKETQTVEIAADDDSYGMAGYSADDAAKVAYLLDDGDTPLTVDELEGMRFTEYTGTFNIEPDQRLVVYARITDHAGNVTYLSSDGLVLDATPPAVTGVDDGGTYYATRVVDVADDNLDTVTLDGAPVTGGSFELAGNVDRSYVIVATDRAGNVTEVTVTMKPIEDLAGQIEDLTPDTVDPDDRETVEAVKDAAEENLEDATDEERAELEDLIERCDELLEAIDAAEAAAAAEAEAARLAGTGDTLPVIAVCSLLVVGALAIAGGRLMRRGSRF